MQCPRGTVHPLPASPSAPAAADTAATLAATTTAASSITTPAAVAATAGITSAATAATDPDSCQCVDAYLAYLAASAKQDVAFLFQPSALHGDCNIPVRPTAAAYQAAFLAAAQAFKCNLQSVANRYSEHTSQASAWRLYLLYRSQFLLLHETAPILASLCKQFLHTLSLLCWFHVKHGTRMARPRCSPKSNGQKCMASWRRSCMQRPGRKSANLPLHLCNAIRSRSQLQSNTFRTTGSVKSGSVGLSVGWSSKALSACQPSH